MYDDNYVVTVLDLIIWASLLIQFIQLFVVMAIAGNVKRLAQPKTTEKKLYIKGN